MIEQQRDGTYIATYNSQSKVWKTRKQAANWVNRRQHREISVEEYGEGFINRHAIGTLAEVAEILDMTPVRVQQLERLAFRKMRIALRADGTEREWFEN